jgi:hypothetical protein
MTLKESEEDDDLEEENAATEETDEGEEEAGEEEAEESEAPALTDNVGDASVEINVEELIHELEADDGTSRPRRELAAKRRLEELMEKKRSKRELEDFDDYEV